MIDRNAMIAKIETILDQFDRGNGRKTSGGPVNNDLAREIVQRLQTDGDLKADQDAPDMEMRREHLN
ncbi:hypothetical protein [Aureimonas leprariae]|uniref:Uncharacterized protein n=1 Tax=Plantimonas leprariae TaxID=2615207 RepID=A0A7V7PSE9_9HYPH|nr:hypothetical protein [Aureimonas leprariae]KAB0682068.1 hypothetical protein F6X38_04520 [Aureimonas leprariae]